MLTIKGKIEFTSSEQEEKFNQYCEELTWVWNRVLNNQLYNECLNWYKSVEKIKAKIDDEIKEQLAGKKKKSTSTSYLDKFLPFDFEGVIKTPLQFHDSLLYGVSCRIAYGGNYWKKDESKKIKYRKKKKEANQEDKEEDFAYKHGYKLVKGKKPYTRVLPKEHIYKKVVIINQKKIEETRELLNIDTFNNLQVLNKLRKEQDLPPLITHTDYIGGLVRISLKTSWEAFRNPNLLSRKKLKFKHDEKVSTLINDQSKPLKINEKDKTITLQGLGVFKVIDKNFFKRISGEKVELRTFTINKRSSGLYINLVVAHNLVSEKAKIQNKVKTVTKTLKQANEENNLEAVEMLTNIKEQHIQSIEQIDNQIKKDNYDKYIKRNKRNLSTGIDPGVKAIVALDNGALFNPNIKRERIEVHIAQLQNELKKVQLINDKQHQGDERRKKTNNEIKLQQKISRLHERAANSSNAFNHKLSTRIVRTYATMSIEDTQVKNMVKKATPVLSGEFDGYEKNNASAKTGLNNSLKTRCIGDLKAKIKSKAEVSGANFVASPAKNSSLKCPTCGVVGKKEEVRTQQHLFVCHNEKCSDYKVEKQADINAAINHRLAAGITEKPILKYNIQQLEYKRPIKFKKKKNESLDKKRVDGL